MALANDELRPFADDDEGDGGQQTQRENMFVGAEEADHPMIKSGWSYRSICMCGLLIVAVFMLGVLAGENADSVIPQTVGSAPTTGSATAPTIAITAPPSAPSSHAGPAPTAPAPVVPKPTAKPTEEAKTPTLKVTKAQREAMRKATEELMEMLEDYYGEHQDMLYEGFRASRKSTDTDLRAQANKATNGVAQKIAEALVDPDQTSFIVGVIGSSVAAGHDNCYYDAYEAQMERLWNGVWKAAGMKLEVRNAGQGGGCGDTYENQVWCLKQTAGQDIDIAHYTWTYFENNNRFNFHEVFIRNALLLPKHPAPQIWATGAGNCFKDSPLPAAYSSYGVNYLCLEKGLKSGGIYPGKKWGVIGDGYHNTTRYGEQNDDLERKHSLGVVFRNWHPGPLGFQYISDAFVYGYAEATLMALDMIDDEETTGGDLVQAFARPIYTASDLPDPVRCVDKFCPQDEPSECLNLEEPTFGYHGASVASRDDDLNVYANTKQDWANFRMDKGPNFMVNKAEIKYMRRDPTLKCAFSDHCAGFRGTWDSGNLVFRLPKMSMGVISVCMCCAKNQAEKFRQSFVDWVDFELDGDFTLDKSKFFAGGAFGKKCLTIMDSWPDNLSNDKGHFYLAIRVRDDLIPEGNRSKFEMKVDHIITL